MQQYVRSAVAAGGRELAGTVNEAPAAVDSTNTIRVKLSQIHLPGEAGSRPVLELLCYSEQQLTGAYLEIFTILG